MMSRGMGTLVLASTEEGEDNDKEVYDIQVELEGGEDVFLFAQLVLATSNQHLCVVRQELQPKKRSR